MKNKINAIILAAEMGNRLSHLTKDIPKGMVKLFEKSLLEMQIDIFKGITNYRYCKRFFASKKPRQSLF